MNGLDLNVLTKEENFILDIIDKIQDPEEKRKTLAKYIEVAKEEVPQRKNQKGLQAQIQRHQQQYSFNEILKRIRNTLPEIQEPTVSDLKQEISQTKRDLKDLKTRVQILELQQCVQTPLISKNEIDNKEEDFDNLLEEVPKIPTDKEKEILNEEEDSHSEFADMHFVNSLDRVVNHKWYSKVTIVINKEYSFKAEAQ